MPIRLEVFPKIKDRVPTEGTHTCICSRRERKGETYTRGGLGPLGRFFMVITVFIRLPSMS
jgi:hypothetical protein